MEAGSGCCGLEYKKSTRRLTREFSRVLCLEDQGCCPSAETRKVQSAQSDEGQMGVGAVRRSDEVDFQNLREAHVPAALDCRVLGSKIRFVHPVCQEVCRVLLEAASAPLSGHTFAVEDSICVKGIVKTMGCPDYGKGTSSPTDAACVELLLAAGAMLVGVCHMEELGIGVSGDSLNLSGGFRGCCHNPAAPGHLTGGPSCGAATSVSMGAAGFALGTGVLLPAALCRACGFQSSPGIINNRGITTLSQSMNALGWVARDVRMLQQVGKVLLQSRRRFAPGALVPQMTPRSPRGPSKISLQWTAVVVADTFDCIQDERVGSALHQCATIAGQAMREERLGQRLLLRVSGLGKFDDIGNGLGALRRCVATVTAYQAWQSHGMWVSQQAPKLTAESANWMQEARILPESEFLTANAVVEEAQKEIDKIFEELSAEGFPVLVIPSAPGPALRPSEKEASWIERAQELQAIYAAGGLPAVTLPVVTRQGRGPLGLTLLGRRGSDTDLLLVAARFATEIAKFGALDV